MKVYQALTSRPQGSHLAVAHRLDTVDTSRQGLRRAATSYPNLVQAAQGALRRSTTRGCLSSSDAFAGVMVPPLPSLPAPKIDWQARVGWPGRFEKVAVAQPSNPEKPHHLGRGKIAKVVRMREVATGRDVAIKKFKDNTGNCIHAADSAAHEFDITRGLHGRHTIVAEAIAKDAEGKKAFLVFPLVDGAPFVKAQMSRAVARQVMMDIITAVNDLVLQGVSHNDIHANNILVAQGRGYLIDFGQASLNDDNILWRRDMRMLRDVFMFYWPGLKSKAAIEFFDWLKLRIKKDAGEDIAKEALQHPYLATDVQEAAS